MIFSWMVYALAVALLVSLAALAAERVLILLRRPVRGVWAFGLVLSLLIPALSPLLPRRVAMPAPVERALTVTRDAIAAPVAAWRAEPAAAGRPGRGIDRALLVGWIVLSVGLVQLVLYSMSVLHGRRREWTRRRVDGVLALISPDFGPAVVGWRRLEIVLPAWTLDLAPDARSLVVRHEQEHVTRGDPRLLLHAFVLVIIMPWNPLLWWQYRRLRRAVELDCDARVVGSGVPAARYGEVLLEAVDFCRKAALPALASFAERATDLEARIEALTRRPPSRRGLRLALAGSAALVLGAAACILPDPLSPALDSPPAQTNLRPDDLSSPGWVRQHLAGRGPAELVLIVQSFEGKLLHMELRRATPGGDGRPLLNGVLQRLQSTDIQTISVLKERYLQVPGIKDVILVRLKPGVRVAGQATPQVSAVRIDGRVFSARGDSTLTLQRYLAMYGRGYLFVRGVTFPPKRNGQ